MQKRRSACAASLHCLPMVPPATCRAPALTQIRMQEMQAEARALLEQLDLDPPGCCDTSGGPPTSAAGGSAGGSLVSNNYNSALPVKEQYEQAVAHVLTHKRELRDLLQAAGVAVDTIRCAAPHSAPCFLLRPASAHCVLVCLCAYLLADVAGCAALATKSLVYALRSTAYCVPTKPPECTQPRAAPMQHSHQYMQARPARQ